MLLLIAFVLFAGFSAPTCEKQSAQLERSKLRAAANARGDKSVEEDDDEDDDIDLSSMSVRSVVDLGCLSCCVREMDKRAGEREERERDYHSSIYLLYGLS